MNREEAHLRRKKLKYVTLTTISSVCVCHATLPHPRTYTYTLHRRKHALLLLSVGQPIDNGERPDDGTDEEEGALSLQVMHALQLFGQRHYAFHQQKKNRKMQRKPPPRAAQKRNTQKI